MSNMTLWTHKSGLTWIMLPRWRCLHRHGTHTSLSSSSPPHLSLIMCIFHGDFWSLSRPWDRGDVESWAEEKLRDRRRKKSGTLAQCRSKNATLTLICGVSLSEMESTGGSGSSVLRISSKILVLWKNVHDGCLYTWYTIDGITEIIVFF